MRDNGFIQFLLHPLRSIWSITYGDQGDWAVEQGPMKLFLAVVFFPFYLFAQFIVFIVVNWTVTRNGRKFLFGAPALALVVLALVAIFIFQYFKETVANRYRGEFHSTFQAEDYETASLWCDKVLSISPDDSEYRYGAASVIAATNQENPEKALGAMLELAPIEGEELGNIDAHLWCARFYMDANREPGKKPDEKVLAKDHALALPHLNRAKTILESESNQLLLLDRDFKTTTQYAETYARIGFTSEAKWKSDESMTHIGVKRNFDEFKKSIQMQAVCQASTPIGVHPALIATQAQTMGHHAIVKENDKHLLKALEEYKDAGRYRISLFPNVLQLVNKRYGSESPQFNRELKNATDVIELISMNSANSFLVWQTLVRCYVVGDKYIEAEQQINRASTMVTNPRVSARLRQLQSGLFVHAFDNYKYEGSEEKIFQTRIRWLTRSLQIYPRNQNAISKMVGLIEPPHGPLTDEQIDWLRSYTVDEQFSFVAHLIQGMDSALKSLNSDNPNDKNDAILQWRLAVSDEPGSIEVLTTVANYWSLRKEDENLDPINDPKDPQNLDTPENPEQNVEDKKDNKKEMTLQQKNDPDFNVNDHLNDYQISNTNRAIRLMDLAIEMSPEEVAFLEMRGALLYRVKRYTDAYDDLQTAYEMNASRPAVVQFLVYCAEKLKKEDDLKMYKNRLETLREQFESTRSLASRSK